MNVETRKTAAGTEYWDNEAKKVKFVPAGQKPDFEVTKNPKSMLEDGKGIRIGKELDFNEMTANELKRYVKDNQIELPADITKKDDIIKYLSESE